MKDIIRDMANEVQDEGWSANQKYVLSQITSLHGKVEASNEGIDFCKTGISEIKLLLAKELTSLKLKSSLWGALASLPATLLSVITFLIILLKAFKGN